MATGYQLHRIGGNDDALMTGTSPRILLGHLVAFGDCLYATVIARQIKHDFPGCHLTWAIATPYREIIENNPYVDAIWEVPISRGEAVTSGWRVFVREAEKRRKAGVFDRVFFTQILPDNVQNFDGTVRASIFNGYPGKITVPLNPVLRLRSEEVDRVRAFAGQHQLSSRRHVILFECSGLSGQTFVTLPFALETARRLLRKVEDCCILLSSSERSDPGDPRIIDASVLTFRENAELTHYATLFVGCSSGLTWLSTSEWAKHLPTIQLLRRATSIYASMVHDAEYFGLPHDHIIEMTDCTAAHLSACIDAVLTMPFAEAHARFHESIRIDHQFYFNTFLLPILKRGQVTQGVRSLSRVIRRYGVHSITNALKAAFDTL